jgi:hypothetical protein
MLGSFNFTLGVSITGPRLAKPPLVLVSIRLHQTMLDPRIASE